MPQLTIPYGKTKLNFSLPDSRRVTLLAPNQADPAPDPLAVVNQALAEPVGDARLADFADAHSAAIAINDKTRPVPHHHLLPPLLTRLEKLGLPPEAITLVIATGTHPPLTPDEYPAILPLDIIARYPIICHDAEDKEILIQIGQTERGTPVWINSHYANADLRLVVGNMEPHQFMGFSGGVKSAVIGVAGTETINHNHAMMTHSHAKLGQYGDNPARQDVEEMGRMVGIHFALNAILNEQKQIVRALAGAPQAVMQQGIPLVRQIFQLEVAQPFDLTIASPGGHPKDINLYQSQKGLAHAALVTKEGGTIILAAACPEGSGSAKYEQWMVDKSSYQDVFEAFQREGFRVGPHKAFQIARDASKVRVRLLSEMPDTLARHLLLTPIPNLDDVLTAALANLPPDAHIGVMPLANATIPVLAHDG